MRLIMEPISTRYDVFISTHADEQSAPYFLVTTNRAFLETLSEVIGTNWGYLDGFRIVEKTSDNVGVFYIYPPRNYDVLSLASCMISRIKEAAELFSSAG